MDSPIYPTWYSGIGRTCGIGVCEGTHRNPIYFTWYSGIERTCGIGVCDGTHRNPMDSPINPTWYSGIEWTGGIGAVGCVVHITVVHIGVHGTTPPVLLVHGTVGVKLSMESLQVRKKLD